MNRESSTGEQVFNAVKFVADTAVLPGASQLVEGDIGTGVGYGLAGFVVSWLTRSVVGPVGWIAVGVDSYSMSTSNKHIWQHFFGSESHTPAVPPAPHPESSKLK